MSAQCVPTDDPIFGPELRPASYGTSQKGFKTLLIDGYEFLTHQRNKDGTVSWRCSYGKCECKGKTSSENEDAVVLSVGDHMGHPHAVGKLIHAYNYLPRK